MQIEATSFQIKLQFSFARLVTSYSCFETLQSTHGEIIVISPAMDLKLSNWCISIRCIVVTIHVHSSGKL